MRRLKAANVKMTGSAQSIKWVDEIYIYLFSLQLKETFL